MGYIDDINKAIIQSQAIRKTAVTGELRKYRLAYKKSIKKIQNLIFLQEDGQKLSILIRQVEDELKVLNNKLTRSAKSLITISTQRGIIDTKTSISMLGGALTGGAKIGMVSEVFDKVWRRALGKMIKGINGITLSTRIWDIHQTTYKDIRRIIAKGYIDGLYPGEIMNSIRGFLYLSQVDMRTTYWKEFFIENPPGRGIYKSAYKNMERLIRTEVTRAYRTATAEYASKKTWVKGLKWNRTPGTRECAECDEYAHSDLYGLGDGVYPPNAIPVSHPNCMCYLTIEPREESVILDKI